MGQREEKPLSRILVVEDNPASLQTLVGVLTGEGFAVSGCLSGQEALACLDDADFDIAIVELRLPDVDGGQLLEQIRARDVNIRIIIHTADRDFDSAERAVNLGIFAYVENADDPAELIRLVYRAHYAGLDQHVQELAAVVRSERRQAEAFRQRSRRQYEAFINSIDGIVWEVEVESFTFSFVSQQAERLLGYPVEQWVNEANFWREHIHPDDREQTLNFCLAAVAERRAHEMTYRMIAKDGRIIWLRDIVSVIEEPGQPLQLRGVMVDISEQKRAEDALQRLSRQLLETQENERRYIAKELHDEIGQALTALKINLELVQEHPEELPMRIQDSIEILDRTLDQVRDLSLDLRPSILDDFGLFKALRWYIDRQSRRTSMAIQLIGRELPQRPRPDLETTCFRVVQEALTNVVRHAQARCARVEVQQRGDVLQLLVCDDGVGFNVQAAQERAIRGESMGLMSMQERVQLMGGAFRIESRSGQGTKIQVSLPLQALSMNPHKRKGRN